MKLFNSLYYRCLIWFDEIRSPVVVKATHYITLMENVKGFYQTQLITCPVPKELSTLVPQAISLQSTDNCKQMKNNVLRVIFEPKLSINQQSVSKPSIGICVKAFRYGAYDISVRLIEWLEMVRILGAGKVYFYVFGAMDNLRKLLKHYQQDVRL